MRFWTAMVLVAVLPAPALAQTSTSKDAKVQAPELSAPQRGSVAGQLSGTVFGPADVARGGFTLPAPMSAPGDRGPLLASVFPTYSPEAGMSEWGLGWSTSLLVYRSRVVGDVDYSAGDELTGPWGRLVKGSDGYWYPAGLQKAVRVAWNGGDTMTAYEPDGTQEIFGGSNRVSTSQGTYSWALTDVVSVTGRRTHLTWTAGYGRLFLSSVSYGGFDLDFQYRIDLAYEALPTAFKDYRSRAAASLDRRVKSVTVFAKNASTGSFDERWHHDLVYVDEGLGPASYLSSVQQVFRSGEAQPPVLYTYSLAKDRLASAQLTRSSKVDAVLALAPDALQPSRSAQLDSDQDGLPDLEFSKDYTLIHQTTTGFELVPLGSAPPNVYARCRNTPSSTNNPRNLAGLLGDDSWQVVSLGKDALGSTTTLAVCSRDGVKIGGQTLTGDWTFSSNLRLVDLNHDHKPDLVRISYGSYKVLPNTSSGSGTSATFSFGTAKSGTLSPAFSADTSWVQDMNGDGVPDLVARTASSVTVWFGKGNFEFDSQGKTFTVKDASGSSITSLSSFSFTFVDANRDGLTDLLLTSSGSRASLFINNGSLFQYASVPGLAAVDLNTSAPVVADLSGSGDLQLTYTKNSVGYVFPLEGPETGLLSSADDGKGTVLRFEYSRSNPTPGARARQAVLQSLTVRSSGYGDAIYSYGYDQPYLHSLGKFLVGFGIVQRSDGDVSGVPLSTSWMQLLNGDTYAALPSQSGVSDAYAPGLEKFTETTYSDVPFQGFTWKRLASETSGWRSVDPASPASTRISTSTTTSYLGYALDVCPSSVEKDLPAGTLFVGKHYASLPAFSLSLACIPDEVTEATPRGVDYEFSYRTSLLHNDVGQVTQVASISDLDSSTWVLQNVSYDSRWRPQSVSAPGQGTTTAAYDPVTGLLASVTAPTGVVVSAAARDPLTDAMLQLHTDRGSLAYDQWYRYDGQERLSYGWDSIGSGTQLNPDFTFSYRYATATTPASILSTILVDSGASSVRTSVDLLTAKGEAIGSAAQIPEGWALGRITYRDPAAGHASSYTQATLAPGADPGLVTLASLFDGAQSVTDGHFGPLGAGSATTRLHADVQQRVVDALGIDQELLVKSSTENGSFVQTRATDAAGNQVGYWNEAGTAWGYVYDALGRLREVRLPDGKKHSVAYDGHGRVSRVRRDDIATIEYAYDPTTGLLTQKRFRGNTGVLRRTETTTYDSIGRLSVELHQTAGSSDQLSFRYYYDGASAASPSNRSQLGLLTSVTGNAFEKLFSYRADGKLVSRALTLAGGWRRVESTLSYNEAGEPSGQTTTVRASDGTVLSSSSRSDAYDTYGRIASARLGGATLSTYAYDGNGQLQQASLPGGDWVQLKYDDVTRALTGTSQRSAGVLSSVQRRLSNRDLVESDGIKVGALSLSRAYGYSDERFLTSSTDARVKAAYQYSPSGVPTSVVENGAQFVVATLKDDLGRTIQRGDLAFTYGPDGQLAYANRATQSFSFAYDENGQRLLKYLNGNPVAAYPEEGFLDAAGLTESVKLAGRSVGFLQNGTFEPRSTDLLGSVIADANGTPRIASPYGNRWLDGHPSRSAALDYVEKGFDQDLGLVRMGVRDYDPELAIFTTPDPLFLENATRCVGHEVECGLFSYANSDPTSFVDATGLTTEAARVLSPETVQEVARAAPQLRLIAGGAAAAGGGALAAAAIKVTIWTGGVAGAGIAGWYIGKGLNYLLTDAIQAGADAVFGKADEAYAREQAQRRLLSPAEIKEEDRDSLYIVRLQAQASARDGRLEKSVVLASRCPISVSQGLWGLNKLRAQLSPRELKIREPLFQKAEKFMFDARAAGGAGPPGRSFSLPNSTVRVDAEIWKGVNFVN